MKRVNKKKAKWEGLCPDFHCILHKIIHSILMMFIMGGRAESYQRICILINGGQTNTLFNEYHIKI